MNKTSAVAVIIQAVSPLFSVSAACAGVAANKVIIELIDAIKRIPN
jgi:hypothetical protein